MLIIEVMTRNPETVTPSDTIQTAAQLMDELNVGVLPVVEGPAERQRLVGMLTDRDIVIRSTAAGENPATAIVEAAMTTDVRSCYPDTPVEELLELMQGLQVRRVPVVDGDRRLVGIVSLGDLAADDARMAADALEDISIPAPPDR